MKCKKCGNELSENAAFCGKCGTKVEKEEPKPAVKKCSKCGKELSGNELFCSACGARANDQKQPFQEEKNYDSFTQGKSSLSPAKVNDVSQQTNNRCQPNGYTPGLGLVANIPTTFWIAGLRLAAYIGLLAVFILGIFQWTKLADYGQGGLGFIVFLICAVVGFLMVAALMVFLDMAKDIRKMRKKMEEQ